MELADWLDAYSGTDFVLYAKRLSANDTQANGSHQAGPHIRKDFLFRIFPALNRADIKNPDLNFDLSIDSHGDKRKARVVWYNNKFHGNSKSGRNEARITGLGGLKSALLNPENTGAIAVFAFSLDSRGVIPACHIWVCHQWAEENMVEARLGPIDPGQAVVWPRGHGILAQQARMERPKSCWLNENMIPEEWMTRFPSGRDIIKKAIELRSDATLPPDKRLLSRRECEYEIFRSVEEAIELPHIIAGFASVDMFVTRAQTILQRRKARSGRSLELHAREIFLEENLVEGISFSHQPVSENGKTPDFLFPSMVAYQDASFPKEKLRMLAVKTTCKDRWRQILNEADLIAEKHLLTLQEGVSLTQFAEMQNAGVKLVVPEGLIKKFPREVQPHLQTLANFINDVRLLSIKA